MINVPQIVGFSKVSNNGRVRLNKAILKRLGTEVKAHLTAIAGDEFVIAAAGSGDTVEIEKGTTIAVPGRLNLSPGSMVCFVERSIGLAVKAVEVVEKTAALPGIVDEETQSTVTRVVRSFPEPEILIQSLDCEDGGRDLLEKVSSFWKDRDSKSGIVARQILGTQKSGDSALLEDLRRNIAESQHADGSFDRSIVYTCRCIEDLIDLGVNPDESLLRRAGTWLMSRKRSEHNPGMFFLNDDLVDEQVRIVELRCSTTGGPRKRFRERKKSEMREIERYDPLFTGNVCGPRIMWPNGIALHALLRLRMGGQKRVQELANTLLTNEWCECGYQHGTADWRRVDPMTDDDIAAYEDRGRLQFLRGGLYDIADLAGEYGLSLLRQSHLKRDDIDEYPVALPTHIQSCEYMTVYGASRTDHQSLKRFAEGHLWRFAGLLYAGFTGNLAARTRPTLQERYFTEVAFFLLRIFSEYRHPAARLGILLSFPWLADNQNPDGSWGKEPYVESASLAVTAALTAVADY